MEERKDPDFAKLLYRMKVVDADGETEMTLDQWEAASEFPVLFGTVLFGVLIWASVQLCMLALFW